MKNFFLCIGDLLITVLIIIVLINIYKLEDFNFRYTKNKNNFESSKIYNKNNKQQVELVEVIDGDTAKFKKGNEVFTFRFLYVDTPESTTTKEAYGEKASSFTEFILGSADCIEVEYDQDKKDRYGRELVWVWVDGMLLQEVITREGYSKQFYDYGTYKYEDIIHHAMTYAKNNNKNYYSHHNSLQNLLERVLY